VLSQLFLFRYLSSQWPVLNHPYEPPTSNVKDSVIPDGSLKGIPLHYNRGSKIPQTSVQCIGENFESNAWLFRSCRFQNLCFDTNQKDFVFIQSTAEKNLRDTVLEAKSEQFVTISSLFSENTKISLGPIHSQISPQDEEALRWFPKIIQQADLSSGFY
jgi:hypothetical protein